MKKIAVLLSFTVLTGCSTFSIPSFWDDNQSQSIVTVRLQVDKLDCSTRQHPQVQSISEGIRWFELYSESKGSRQQDVLSVIKPMRETVDDFLKRTQEKDASVAYCEGKKKVLVQQAKMASSAVLSRY